VNAPHTAPCVCGRKKESKKTPNEERTPERLTPDHDKRVQRELERVAHSEPRSGREALAKVTALRTLNRRNDRRRRKEPPACPPDWHPHPGSVLAELDEPYFEEHPDARQRLFDALWEADELDEGGRYTG
jgi:hypothetical protein